MYLFSDSIYIGSDHNHIPYVQAYTLESTLKPLPSKLRSLFKIKLFPVRY
jgi:hypothetical protein